MGTVLFFPSAFAPGPLLPAWEKQDRPHFRGQALQSLREWDPMDVSPWSFSTAFASGHGRSPPSGLISPCPARFFPVRIIRQNPSLILELSIQKL